VVSNEVGSAISAPAQVTVTAPEFTVRQFAPQGRRNQDVSELTIEFTEAVDAATFTSGDVLISGPGGSIGAASILVTPLSSNRFQIAFPMQSDEGLYTVSIGPAILNLTGQPMTPGAFSVQYQSGFDTVNPAVWSRTDTGTNSVTGIFLGRFASSAAALTLPDLPLHTHIRVSWDALIFDSWDGNAGPDYFGLNITGAPEPVWEHTFHSSGHPSLQSYSQYPDLGPIEFSATSGLDSIYRGLQVQLPHTTNEAEVILYGRNLQPVNDESWGIDNLRVGVAASTNGTYISTFRIDKTPPAWISMIPSGTRLDPVDRLDVVSVRQCNRCRSRPPMSRW
jgi:hypothetical protein